MSELAMNGETVVVTAGDVFERGFAGVVGQRSLGMADQSAAALSFFLDAEGAFVLAETYDEVSGAWKFNAPMVGFGAGAWVLAMAHRGGVEIAPACGEYEVVSLPLDGGLSVVDAGTQAAGDAGMNAPQPPKGCGCDASPSLVCLLVCLIARRRSPKG